MTTLHPDHFPSLRAAARRPDQFDKAVYAIADGVASGSIRNIVLKDAKDTLSRAVDAGWEKACLLYTSPSPRDGLLSRMPSSA